MELNTFCSINLSMSSAMHQTDDLVGRTEAKP